MKTGKRYRVFLYDAQGRLQQQLAIQNREQVHIPMQGYSAGLYFLTLYNEGDKRLMGTFKIVKQ